MMKSAPDESPNALPLVEKINRISSLDLEGARTAWRSEFRKDPPRSLSRDLLVRMLAWRLQEEAFGGHDRQTIKLLEGLARGKAGALGRRLKPGTILVREYQGQRHTVTIVQGGFTWEGKTYPSLTQIARTISGTNWNGPRFFGLRESSGKKSEAAP